MTSKQTKIYRAPLTKPQLAEVLLAAKNNALFIIPTDTVYGLCAAALSPQNAQKINAAKQNPPSKPMQILCTKEQAKILAAPSSLFNKLAAKFWPGPLTLIVKASARGAALQGGLLTIGLRAPKAALARQIMRAAKAPLFATSANMHGASSPDSGTGIRFGA